LYLPGIVWENISASFSVRLWRALAEDVSQFRVTRQVIPLVTYGDWQRNALL
jgi:hypothetical protein